MRSEQSSHLIAPQWSGSARVRAFTTLRHGGVSSGPWGLAGGDAGGWNLGEHCGDAPEDVRMNRHRLRGLLPAEPVWLEQVHGTEVFDADAPRDRGGVRPRADAAVTTRRGVVLTVLTADCVPILLAEEGGAAIGVAHAGWRGLAAGVLERTVAALNARAGGGALRAWLGPGIGSGRFEVGDDVLDAFVAADPEARQAFRGADARGKWFADLYLLARQRLVRCGVNEVSGGDWCTASSRENFYSFRRDRVTGRMASVIWID